MILQDIEKVILAYARHEGLKRGKFKFNFNIENNQISTSYEEIIKDNGKKVTIEKILH